MCSIVCSSGFGLMPHLWRPANQGPWLVLDLLRVAHCLLGRLVSGICSVGLTPDVCLQDSLMEDLRWRCLSELVGLWPFWGRSVLDPCSSVLLDNKFNNVKSWIKPDNPQLGLAVDRTAVPSTVAWLSCHSAATQTDPLALLVPRASCLPHMGQIELWPQLLSLILNQGCRNQAPFTLSWGHTTRREGTDSAADSLSALLRSDVNPPEVVGQVFSSSAQLLFYVSLSAA